MWTWRQSTGELADANGVIAARGYSGFNTGKNNPLAQNIPELGPIPQGYYSIGRPRDEEGGPHGTYVLPLFPDEANVMFHRSGFLIHGDLISHAGSASHGCIILNHATRVRIAQSGDYGLQVIA